MFESQDRNTDTRPPAVAGTFYPAEAQALRHALREAFLSPFGPGFLPTVSRQPARVFGAVVPHAGYLYSAPAAAWSFAEIAAQGVPEAMILLGINHRGYGAPLALAPQQGWRTPLGVVPCSRELSEALRDACPALVYDATSHQYEHSLEVQLPFIQFLFGEMSIVPVAIGHTGVAELRQLGDALAMLSRERRVLVLASSDFSHYVSQNTAMEHDNLALDQIVAVDPEGLLRVVQHEQISMCGVFPVTAMLFAAKALALRRATCLHYHTSGDILGEYREVVGYGAAVIYRDGDP